MPRRRKGDPVHGWLALNKPTGMTSTKALAIAKRLFNAQKAGHAGTLDPLATGVLPIAFGEATKTTSFAIDGQKTYRFTVAWGSETDTDDCEGEVVQRSDQLTSTQNIEAILPEFVGAVTQVPPAYSAIKIDGQRAYDLARAGDQVDLEPRQIRIDDLRLLESDSKTAVFEATCGKGTYVRALARDIGRKLGCLGHVTALRRNRVGRFNLDDAITLDELAKQHEDTADSVGLREHLKPIQFALDQLNCFRVEPSDAAQLARGQSILIRGRDALSAEGPVYATAKGRLIALGEIEKGTFKPTRVFNYTNSG